MDLRVPIVDTLNPLLSLEVVEKISLVGVLPYGDDNLVEEWKCLSHNVFVPFREGTERSGIYGVFFHGQSRMMVKL